MSWKAAEIGAQNRETGERRRGHGSDNVSESDGEEGEECQRIRG